VAERTRAGVRVDELLGHPGAERAGPHDPLGEVERGVRQLARRDDCGHQPGRQGFRGAHLPPGQQHLGGPALADQARQAPRHAHLAAGHADLDVGGDEYRRLRRHPDIGGQREGESPAGGGAVDGGDDGDGQFVQADGKAGQPPLPGHERGRPALGGVAVVVTGLHVEARAEASPCAGQQDHPAGRIAFHVVKRGVQVRDEGVVDRVQSLRAVECQPADSWLRLVDDDGGHGQCGSSLSR
jgi:hypothetical protein